MKRLLLLAILSVNSIFSQNEKGTKLISVGFNYFSENSNSVEGFSKNKNFGLSPKIGYFVEKNLAVGLTYSFSSRDYESGFINGNNISSSEKSNSFGIFSNLYKEIAGDLHFVADASILYLTKNEKNSNSINSYSELEMQGLSVGIRPGLIYFLTPNLSIQTLIGSLSYENLKNKNKNSNGTSKSERFQANFNTYNYYLILNFHFK